MSTIDDLNKSISESSDEELMQLLKDVRASRRITKKTSKVRNATIKKVVAPAKAIQSLTPEAMATLLSELEEEIR